MSYCQCYALSWSRSWGTNMHLFKQYIQAPVYHEVNVVQGTVVSLVGTNSKWTPYLPWKTS